jgi:hypothetical protein
MRTRLTIKVTPLRRAVDASNHTKKDLRKRVIVAPVGRRQRHQE